MFHRQNLAADLLEPLGMEPREAGAEPGEPSNFQAWYVRSANNSRERSEARLEAEQESAVCSDQEMEEQLEEAVGAELLEEGQQLASPAHSSLPSNHNPFLGEPAGNLGSNGNLAMAVGGAVGGAIRRNSGFVRNVNQGPGTPYNWQSTKQTVKERFAFMFNNEILSDVHFKVKFNSI